MLSRKSLQFRISVIRNLFLLAFFLIAARAVWIQLFPSSSRMLENIAHNQYQSTINLSPYRGSIYDHRKAPLAISIKAPSVAVNPRVFSPNKKQIKYLSKTLKIREKKIRTLIKKKKYFVWLKRKISFAAAEKVKNLKLPGVHFLLEPSRYYPGGSAASQLLGYVGTDNTGLLGIENKYDEVLKGSPSKLLSLKDARGQQILLNASKVGPETAGNNLFLTLDRVVQEIAEHALKSGMEKSEASRGFAAVMDPHTGRLLALANYPIFDPNSPKKLKIENTNNLALNHRFEPGSVMKPFVIASAIENKLTSPYELHQCEKSGRFQVDKRSFIHDDHPKEFRTTEEILIHSSNICTYKIAQRLGRKGLFDAFKLFGFASPDEPFLNLPGESRGSISSWKKWKPLRFANISFGQGLLVNGLEILQAYASLANGGHLVRPFLVERIETQKGEILHDSSATLQRKIISTETAKIIKGMLEKVVNEGTATNAASKLYETAGKTGTAEVFDLETRSYNKDKRIASFAGIAPVTDPHLVVYVLIDEPKKKPYYGGLWAAPVFKEIIERTLKYLNVTPKKQDPFPSA